MKIYHTETQADYDALMAELEKQGCKWGNRENPTKGIRWETRGDATCVHVSDAKIMTVVKKSFFAYHSPDIPITKYKAKVDEKMKFTKENVEKVIDEYFLQADFESCGDLLAEIHNLDDTPEKVVVPKCFDDWYKEIEAKYQRPSDTKKFALWKLCQKGFGYGFERVDGEKICYKSELGKWLLKNTFLAIDAVLNGYTIEPEQLYYIPLPYLETSDGIQQVLSKRDTYFASRPNEKLKQRYTKEELEQVPEIYKPYAKPIEEE